MMRVLVLVTAVGVGLLLAVGVVAMTRTSTSQVGPLEADAYGDRSLLEPGAVEVVTGQATMTSSLQSLRHTVRVGPTDVGLLVDETAFTCHGGMAHVVWHVGNLEPVHPDTGIHLAMRFDGQPIAGLLRGDPEGIWGDDPAEIHATVQCAEGDHVVDIELIGVTGGWGLPYVANTDKEPPPGLVVNRGFVITEVWQG